MSCSSSMIECPRDCLRSYRVTFESCNEKGWKPLLIQPLVLTFILFYFFRVVLFLRGLENNVLNVLTTYRPVGALCF